MDIEKLAKLVQSIAKECGDILSDAFRKQSHVILTKESEVDLVTQTDKMIEKYIIGRVKELYPDHKIIGEESTADGENVVLSNDTTWVIDPIDGTTNFVGGFPYVAVCIGIMIAKEPVIGCVYNPIMNQLFFAQKGKGATLNGWPITTKKETDLRRAVVNTEFGSSRDPGRMDTVVGNIKNIIMVPVRGIRSLGSAACNICAVAQGLSDAYFETGMHIWDICAAGLILTEAGGVMTNTDGTKLNYLNRNVIAAGTIELVHQISSQLTEITVMPDGVEGN